MLNQLRDFVRSFAVLSKTTSLSDLRARHDKTAAELRAAEDAHRQAQEAYVSAVAGAATDDVALARKHKAVSEAHATVKQRRDSLQVLAALVDEAHRRESETATLKAWDEAGRKAAKWQALAEQLQEELAQVAETFEEAVKLGMAFRASLPVAPATSEDAYILWSKPLLARHAQLYLFAKSNGAFESRAAASPWQIAQGPDLRRRVADSIALALRNRPQRATPEPPEAA